MALATALDEDDADAAADYIESAKDRTAALSEVAPDIPEELYHQVLGRADYIYFAERYLKQFFWYPFNKRYHGNLFKALRQVETHEVKQPTIVAGGRESGKSVYGNLLLPLHCICYPQWEETHDGRVMDISKRYITFVQATARMAAKPLVRVAKQLETNVLLQEDFGDFYRDASGKLPSSREWSRVAIQTSNGYTLEAKGRHGKFRGAAEDQHRIGLAIVDDIEDDKSVKKRTRREEDIAFVTTTLNNALSSDYGNMLILGTMLQSNSMLAQLIDFGQTNDWNIRVFPVYERDPQTGELIYLWPERFGPEWVAEKLKSMPQSAFEQEYLQNPTAAQTDLTLDDFQRYSMQDIQPLLDSGVMEVCLGHDPNCKPTDISDFAAFVPTALHLATGIKYVLPPLLARLKFHAKVDSALSMYEKWNADMMVVETNQFQIVLKEEIDRLATELHQSVNVYPVNHTNNKQLRISRLFGPIRAGTIRFLRGDKHTDTVIDQLMNLYTTDYDDGADALEMAIYGHDVIAARRKRKRGGGAAKVLQP